MFRVFFSLNTASVHRPKQSVTEMVLIAPLSWVFTALLQNILDETKFFNHHIGIYDI